MRLAIDLSPRGRARVVLVTIVGTLVCMAAAVYVDSFTFGTLDRGQLLHAILVDLLLPLGLAAPMLGFLMTKLRELAIAKHDLTLLASTDSLTAVLNRGAFTMIVDSYLEKVQAAQIAGLGALLVVDVDNFKGINDRFGHDRGDVALKLIAKAISTAVRGIDLVGRIGGEEFGVFLPGLSVSDAEVVAERIRNSVATADFQPQGSPYPLSVSVGGASFLNYVPYDQLFHVADQRLYLAKERGRNRVEMEPMAAAA
jgi:diguanylate cyclase